MVTLEPTPANLATSSGLDKLDVISGPSFLQTIPELVVPLVCVPLSTYQTKSLLTL